MCKLWSNANLSGLKWKDNKQILNILYYFLQKVSHRHNRRQRAGDNKTSDNNNNNGSEKNKSKEACSLEHGMI